MTLPTPGTAASITSASPPPGRSGPTRSESVRGPGSKATSTVPCRTWAGARAAIRSATSTASSRRSSGRSARAASMPTTRRRIGPTSGPAAIETVVGASTPTGCDVTRRPRGDAGERHGHAAAAAWNGLKFDVVGDRRDQRQAETGTGRVGARPDPTTVVGHDDAHVLLQRLNRDLHGAWLIRRISMAYDVRARLSDREAQVLDEIVGQAEGLGERTQDVTDHRHVLRAGRQRQLDVGFGALDQRRRRGAGSGRLPFGFLRPDTPAAVGRNNGEGRNLAVRSMTCRHASRRGHAARCAATRSEGSSASCFSAVAWAHRY